MGRHTRLIALLLSLSSCAASFPHDVVATGEPITIDISDHMIIPSSHHAGIMLAVAIDPPTGSVRVSFGPGAPSVTFDGRDGLQFKPVESDGAIFLSLQPLNGARSITPIIGSAFLLGDQPADRCGFAMPQLADFSGWRQAPSPLC